MGFGELHARTQRENLSTVEEVVRATGCGGQCQTCRPYISLMLRTGRVPTIDDVNPELHE